MLMVAEMTGNLSMLAPAMIAVGISSILVGRATIYTSQVATRADSPAHRLQLSFPLLSTLAVRQAMTPFALSLSEQQTVAEAENLLAKYALSGTVVLDPRGTVLGILTLADIGRVPLPERAKRLVASALARDILVAHPDETLDVILEQLTSRRVGWMPVVEGENASERGHVLGRITALDITRTYRETVAKRARRMRGLVEGTVMVEIHVEPGMRLAGCALREAQIPPQCLVVSIRRQNEMLFPRGGTVIEPGDLVTFLVSPSGEERLHIYLAERVGRTESGALD